MRQWLRQLPWAAPAVDLLLATVFVVVSQVELHHRVDDGYQAGPMWLNVPLVLLMAAPLALRTRAPRLGLGIALGAACLPGLVLAHTVFFWGSMIPIALLTYSVARHGDSWVARQAWLAGPLLVAANMPHVAELRSMSNIIFGLGVYGLAWLVGRVLHRLEDRDRQLRAALARLAEEQQLREQAAVAAERSRIAAEMHDVVAHAVTLMVVQVGAARMKLGESAPSELRAAELTGREALVELRRTLGLLRYDGRSTREPLPGVSRLEELGVQCRSAGVDLQLEVGELGALSPSLELATYRMLQESLTNVVRHAGAVRARASVAREEDTLRLEVANEPGRPREVLPSTGHGLTAMRERAALFGGSVEAGPTRAGGFRVLVTLPLGSTTSRDHGAWVPQVAQAEGAR